MGQTRHTIGKSARYIVAGLLLAHLLLGALVWRHMRRRQLQSRADATEFAWAAREQDAARERRSLFCWSLVLPRGGELTLVRTQLRKRWGIFACDGYTVYSNESVTLGYQQHNNSNITIRTAAIQDNLHCVFSGEPPTADNTHIFVKLWNAVISNGSFLLHDWVVKADADTVFIPSRLRDVLRINDYRHAQEGNGMLIRNCHLGLHGPLEVLSRRALEVYSKGHWKCGWPPKEDVFLEYCMEKVLHVQVINQYDLLDEWFCGSKTWATCGAAAVSYHPFKTVAKYQRCVTRTKRVRWHSVWV